MRKRFMEMLKGAFAVFNFDNRSIIRGVYIPRTLLISNFVLGFIVLISMYKISNLSHNIVINADIVRDMREKFIYGMGYVQLLIIILLPAHSANAIIAEKEKENIDHLFLTQLTSFQLIMGKLLSSIGIYLMFFISTIPVLAILISYTGGVSIEDFLVMVLLIIINTFKLSAISIYLSVRVKKAGAAITFAYISIAMIFFFIPAFFSDISVMHSLFSGNSSERYEVIPLILASLPIIFIGFIIAEYYFVLRRKVENWSAYILVTLAGAMYFTAMIMSIDFDLGHGTLFNPIEYLMIRNNNDMHSHGILSPDGITEQLKYYFDIFQYIAGAAISSFAILYLAARRLDVLRWGKV